MWWTGQTSQKFILLIFRVPFAPSPPTDKHVLKKENFATGKTELSKIIADIKTAAQGRCSLDYCSIVVRSSMLLGAMAIFSDTLFSELYVIWVFSFYFSQLIVKGRPDEHIEWIAQGHMHIPFS